MAQQKKRKRESEKTGDRTKRRIEQEDRRENREQKEIEEISRKGVALASAFAYSLIGSRPNVPDFVWLLPSWKLFSRRHLFFGFRSASAPNAVTMNGRNRSDLCVCTGEPKRQSCQGVYIF